MVMPAGEFIFGLGVIGPDPLVPETDFMVKDGHVTPPSGPGLGIAVDERALDALTPADRDVVVVDGFDGRTGNCHAASWTMGVRVDARGRVRRRRGTS